SCQGLEDRHRDPDLALAVTVDPKSILDAGLSWYPPVLDLVHAFSAATMEMRIEVLHIDSRLLDGSPRSWRQRRSSRIRCREIASRHDLSPRCGYSSRIQEEPPWRRASESSRIPAFRRNGGLPKAFNIQRGRGPAGMSIAASQNARR